MAEVFPRGDRGLVVEALGDTRGVFVVGARQVGKSTLAEQIAKNEHPAHVVNLDDKAPREAALADPEGFIAGLRRPVLIDEVQRGSEDLLLAIKRAVDTDLTPGQFLLTGSANVLRNKKISDALTGRIELIRLWPLAQAEIERSANNFVDALFAGNPPTVSGAPVGRDALRKRVVAGGYPEARTRTGRRQTRWFDSYLQTTFEKDLQAITDAHKLHEMPKVLRLLAAQTANLFVPAALASKLALDHRTVERYVGLLETIFLAKRIPAWTPGFGQREVQHPKAYIVDSGLLLHLLGANERRLLNDDQVTGKALENFVAMEIIKHAEWSEDLPRVYHYRRQRDEIDLVLENRAGEIAAIEVKATATVGEKDWRALKKVRDQRGKSFQCGAIVYAGAQTIPLGDRLFAVPLSGLWA
jgi:predicted AAA+ superfamily ATPase